MRRQHRCSFGQLVAHFREDEVMAHRVPMVLESGQLRDPVYIQKSAQQA